MGSSQWRTTTIGEIAQVRGGGVSVVTLDRPAEADEHGVLTLAAVASGRFDPSHSKAVREEDIPRLGSPVVANTILVSRSNTIDLVGACALVDRPFSTLHLPDLTWQVTPADPDSVCGRWLLYSMQAPHMRAQIRAVAVGTSGSMKKLSMKAFRGLKLQLPPIEDQIAMADTLETWDRAITETERRIELSSRLKAGLTQQLLTGKRRFPEFIESSGSEGTRYGPIPRDWQYVEIGDVARHVTARQGDQGGLPVLSCTKHFGLVDSARYFDRQVHSRDTSSYKVVQRGQFAYATNHVEEGSIGLLTHRDAGLVSPMYTVFEVSCMILAPFLFALLKTETYLHIFRSRTSSSVNRRGSLRWKDFSRIHVPVPSLLEQERIAAVLSAVDRKSELLRLKVDLLEKQKRGLMQKLLTGEVRVPAGGD